MDHQNIISIIDYSAKEAYEDPEGFDIIPGNIQDIRDASPEGDNIVNIIAMVFDRYIHWRFVHAIVLTISDYEIFRKYYTKTLDPCMQTIMDYYTLDHEVFMLNLIPYQMTIYEPDIEIDADNTANMFKRWDFIDIGCTIRKRYIAKPEKKDGFLEVKSEPNDSSETVKYISEAQLININRYVERGWYLLVGGGYIKGYEIITNAVTNEQTRIQYIIPYNLDIKKYVQIRCNGIGDAGLTGNFREIW